MRHLPFFGESHCWKYVVSIEPLQGDLASAVSIWRSLWELSVAYLAVPSRVDMQLDVHRRVIQQPLEDRSVHEINLQQLKEYAPREERTTAAQSHLTGREALRNGTVPSNCLQKRIDYTRSTHLSTHSCMRAIHGPETYVYSPARSW